MSPDQKRSKFDIRREATRRSLLALGFERFPTKGYAATSIEDILRDSGHGRGGFYFHFANKEEFFLAVQDYRDEVRGEWWEVVRDPALITIEEVVAATFARLAGVVPTPNPWGLLLAEFWQSVKHNEHHVAAIRTFYQGWQRELVRFCEELAARGFLRTDIPPTACAEILHAVVEGHEIHAQVYAVDIGGMVDTVVRLLRP
ncbi:TetR/AcrR family transcriptional regulator [Nocardioides panacisoli]|uniref:TetR/AcrR family transcriptional regulator n=1 Tax=Nocardioides panacisoli TaxID=627624 RepID=UPI001C63949D|nr:TetR/AcrR family transcriptional regulator [Nocardioides panacisoli]QYJ02562.1 TetR/AcrR family transcriptional regulator [Nocardioides panacisoli]